MTGRRPRSQEKGALSCGVVGCQKSPSLLPGGHLAKNEVTRGKGTGRQRGTLLTTSLEQLGPTIHKIKYFYLTPKLPFLLKPACVWFLKPKHSSQAEMGSTVWSLQPHCEVSTPLISR